MAQYDDDEDDDEMMIMMMMIVRAYTQNSYGGYSYS